jgi:hypothetical protein
MVHSYSGNIVFCKHLKVCHHYYTHKFIILADFSFHLFQLLFTYCRFYQNAFFITNQKQSEMLLEIIAYRDAIVIKRDKIKRKRIAAIT